MASFCTYSDVKFEEDDIDLYCKEFQMNYTLILEYIYIGSDSVLYGEGR